MWSTFCSQLSGDYKTETSVFQLYYLLKVLGCTTIACTLDELFCSLLPDNLCQASPVVLLPGILEALSQSQRPVWLQTLKISILFNRCYLLIAFHSQGLFQMLATLGKMVPWSPCVNGGHCEPQQQSLQPGAVGLLKPSCVLSKLQVWDSSWGGVGGSIIFSEGGTSETGSCTNLHLLNPFILLTSLWPSPAHRIVKASVRSLYWDLLMQGCSTDPLCLLFLLFCTRSQRLLSRHLGQPSHQSPWWKHMSAVPRDKRLSVVAGRLMSPGRAATILHLLWGFPHSSPQFYGIFRSYLRILNLIASSA